MSPVDAGAARHSDRSASRLEASGNSLMGGVSGHVASTTLFTVTVYVLLALLLASGSHFLADGSYQDLLRILSLTVLFPYAFRDTQRTPRSGLQATFQRQETTVFRTFLVGYILYVLSSTFLHAQFGMLLTHIAGGALLLMVVRALSSDAGVTASRSAPRVLGFAIVLSLGAGFLLPDQAIMQGRLRGLFLNANLLGFYAFLSFTSALLLVRRRFWYAIQSFTSIWAILWTDSRTSALAAVSVIVLLSLFSHRRSRFLLLLICGAALLAFVGGFDLDSSSRDLGTRDGSWREALRVLDVAPFTGVGNGNTLVEVASTPLRALAEGGLIALVGVVMMYFVLLRASLRRSLPLFAVCVGAIIHSLGEGWFLSALSPMLLAFVTVWLGVSALGCGDAPSRRRSEPARESTAHVSRRLR